MTWRTFFYCFLCLAAALMVASATGSGAAQGVQEVGYTLLANQTLPTPADADPGRIVYLILGLIAVAVTFQKALSNLRKAA